MKIVICNDGSAQAENAVKYTALIAGPCQAEVTLLGIVEHEGQQAELAKKLQASRELLQGLNIPTQTSLRTGEPIAEIIRYTTESACDLVVLGAVRKGTRGAFWMSAKAYKLIKGILQPALAVIGNPAALRRILICSGGRPQIEKGIEFTGSIAKCCGAEVTLVHVMPDLPAIYPSLIQRQENVEALLRSSSNLGRNLRREKELLESQGIKTNIKIRDGEVIGELLAEVRSGNYDMVVAGSSISGGPLQTYIMGDVTREIVNRADCPVLVTRGEAAKPERFGGFFSHIFGAKEKEEK
ncbi:MAG TPA: universal stress protein [Verrucomicrobiae bacterium]|jgi:nucleotide-binding universal stress UspA family protein